MTDTVTIKECFFCKYPKWSTLVLVLACYGIYHFTSLREREQSLKVLEEFKSREEEKRRELLNTIQEQSVLLSKQKITLEAKHRRVASDVKEYYRSNPNPTCLDDTGRLLWNSLNKRAASQ